MARPRDVKKERAILSTAWKLFDNRGYKQTSYTDIAEKSGINRATVQRYFPKKEGMLIAALTSLRSQCEWMALGCCPSISTGTELLYRLGQIYLAALMVDNRSRRLLCDILEDRSLVEATIGNDLLWSIGYASGRSKGENLEVREDQRMAVIASMGGLYEVMYYCARNDRAFAPAVWMRSVARASADILGMTEQESDRLIRASAIDDAELKRMAEAAYENVFRSFVG